MDNLTDDPGFIDAIVHEVKSQGLFDQFRKECLADVDTKPAYQNLRQRVESSVSKFLSQQKWIDNIRHKNQLREKLRKNIIESGFLETGVERIVDQVVNPKISTVFHPKVEDIVYNYLGIEKPKPAVNGSGGLDVQTDFLLEDLEAVSPDSDKKSSSTSSDIHLAMDQNQHEELNESKHIDDFESPPFEPLETRPPSQTKQESNDSHASAISGLTSQESVEDEPNEGPYQPTDSVSEQINSDKHNANNVGEEQINSEGLAAVDSPLKASPEIVQNDSQLSQVSSNSHLSIITNSESHVQQQKDAVPNPRLDITEEAQMPKFNDNSNEEEGELLDNNDEASHPPCELEPQKSNFDLRKEAYDFKGTDRKRYSDADLKGEMSDKFVGQPEYGHGEGAVQDESKAEERHHVASPPKVPVIFEENSSHSERSLRICEDSTMEQRTLDTSDRLDNCDSAKTPLNDEHSTQSAPDVDKMESSQVEVVVSLAAVQQHASEKEGSRKDRHRGRDNDRKQSSSHRHGSSSSRDDKKSNGSSAKHTNNSSSSRRSDRERDRERDRKHENGNNNSNSGSSKKTYAKRKDDDDHYSSHDKPTKRRRSTDRDSNDGAENGKSAKTSGQGNGSIPQDCAKDAPQRTHTTTDKRGGGMQENQHALNESLDSSFEGFDEDQLHDNPKHIDKLEKILSNSTDKFTLFEPSNKVVKKGKKLNHKDKSKETDRKMSSTMDVFAFSFDKPAKLGKHSEDEPDEASKIEQDFPNPESLDNFDEGVIVLEPNELAKIIQANEQQDKQSQSSTSIGETDEVPQVGPHMFPKTNPDDLVTLATQPVIVDQMLTNGDNMDLELLIGEKQLHGDETTLDKIQQGLDVITNKVRKPKIASNFSEARKLMKVRRQIERIEKKKREQAMALAKKLINENGSEDDQGIELEFVCDGNRTGSGPIISSPVRQKMAKFMGGSEEEPDLLYLPEDDQMFATNDKLLEFLKLRTADIQVPENFMHEESRLHSLNCKHRHEKSVRNIFSGNDDDETMIIEATIEDKNAHTSVLPSKSHSTDSDLSVQQAVKEVEKAATPKQRTPRRNQSRSPPNAVASSEINFEASLPIHCTDRDPSKSDEDNDQPTKENTDNFMRVSKVRRVGLSKPKVPAIHSPSTAILTVDISDVKPISVDKDSLGNNNNGIIKTKRYSSEDLYKPRYHSRTRTRASEQVGI